ncbi:hypothetical protein F4808DRAFT_274939 [Astrocystis sublimbata]|nr:hypothetical protein F4808DRAFT_274939 [Astrocystis sublimbata]
MANPKPSGSIATEIYNVKSLFEELMGASVDEDAHGDRTSPLSAKVVEDMLGRFNIWAGSLGAMHPPQSRLSLEQRLIHAPELLVHVHEHLSEIQESLQDALEISSLSVNNNKADLGADSHKTCTVPEYADMDEQSGEQLVQELSECIRSLFRTAIVVRRASPRDRFAQALNYPQYAFMDNFDIDYVGEKFPKLQNRESTWLKQRLGSAIAKRRQFIKYCYEHKLRLAAEDTDLDAVEKQSTKATTLMPERLNEQLEEFEENDAISMMSVTTVSSSNLLLLPKLETLSPDGEPFECPICCTIQQIQHEKGWKQHAFGDLKAYVCTRGSSETCGRLFFADRTSWFQHELSAHLSAYQCSICGEKSSSGREGLQQHLNSRHGGLSSEQLLPLTDAGIRAPNFFRPQDCPFCEDWVVRLQGKAEEMGSSFLNLKVSMSRFKRHVAAHQEDLALFAMPRNISLEGDDPSLEAASGESRSRHSIDDKVAGVPAASPNERVAGSTAEHSALPLINVEAGTRPASKSSDKQTLEHDEDASVPVDDTSTHYLGVPIPRKVKRFRTSINGRPESYYGPRPNPPDLSDGKAREAPT